MKFTWSVVHFRRFNPNLHNIFAEEAVLCQELEKSPFCMDYLIRTVPVSLEKPYCFYAEPVWNGSAPHRLTASPLKCYRKKPVLRAICITFHTNFTIRSGGHSNFRRSRRFPSDARRPRSAPHKYYLVGKVCGPANINLPVPALRNIFPTWNHWKDVFDNCVKHLSIAIVVWYHNCSYKIFPKSLIYYAYQIMRSLDRLLIIWYA